MATIETVLGPIDDEALGFTLSHEHIAQQPAGLGHHYPWLVDRTAIRERAVRELSEAKAGGIDSIIELSTPDLERDVEMIADVARASGVQVVVATGTWRVIPRGFWDKPIDAIADVYVREIEVGIGDSGIKAGVIKVANDKEGVTEQGERVLRAAARASNRTGRPISTHQSVGARTGQRQVEVFLSEGVPMHRVCIGHSADTTDLAYLEGMLQAGVYLSMDRYPGTVGRLDWERRNATVRALLDRGWAERLMLGHDYGQQRYAEEHPTRYLFLSRVALPALVEAGVSEATIDLMMREVPRRFLTDTVVDG